MEELSKNTTVSPLAVWEGFENCHKPEDLPDQSTTFNAFG